MSDFYRIPNVEDNPKDHLISKLILNQKYTSILLDEIESYYRFRLINILFDKCRTRINSYTNIRFNQDRLFNSLIEQLSNNEQIRLNNYLNSIDRDHQLMYTNILNNNQNQNGVLNERLFDYDDLMEAHRTDQLFQLSKLILELKDPPYVFDLDLADRGNKLVYNQNARDHLSELFNRNNHFRQVNVNEVLINYEQVLNHLIKESKGINHFLNSDLINIENDNLDRAISFKFNLIIQHEFLDFVIKSARNAI